MSQTAGSFWSAMASAQEDEKRIPAFIERCRAHGKPYMPGRGRMWMCPDCVRNDREDDQ